MRQESEGKEIKFWILEINYGALQIENCKMQRLKLMIS